MNLRQNELPIASLERIDDLCAEFEHAWQRNQTPRVESFLQRVSSSTERAALLAELLLLDIEYLRRRGEKPAAAEYLKRFSEDGAVVRKALNECAPRHGTTRFEPPTVDQLAKLFPALEIIELIGAGGMGAVYKARQKGLDRVFPDRTWER